MGDKSADVARTLLSGTVAVEVGGAIVSLTKQTQRMIAALAASRGLAVPADTLADRLWDEPPRQLATALKVAVRRAREQLGDESLIETTPIGYAYRAPTDTVDLWQFESLAERCLRDEHPSIRDLQTCLNLWRGDPFGNHGALPFLLPLSTSLAEQHRTLEERHLTALLASGEHARAIVIAESLVATEPLRENRWVSLMLALYRDGRQADALRAFQRARETLLDAAGLSPGAELVALEARILAQDPALTASQQRPSDPPPVALVARSTTGSPPAPNFARELIGRDGMLEVLTSLATGARVCVVGEPGIGKSSLLAACVASLRLAGRHVAFASAIERPTRPAHALATILEQLDDEGVLRSDTSAFAAALAIAPSLLERRSSETKGETTAEDAFAELPDREHAIASLSDWLTKVVAEFGLAVVVDDCQWLDRLSAEVLSRVAASPGGLVIAGMRPHRTAPMAWIADPATPRLELRGLPIEATRVLLERRGLRSSLVSDAERFHTQSGGNPLLLGLLADAASAGDGFVESPSIREAVRSRLVALSPYALDTLAVAATIGQSFPMEHLLVLRPSARTELLEAADAGLVEPLDRDETPTTSREYRFVHGLVADSIAAELSEGRRIELGDEIGELLKRSGAPASEYARHFATAASLDPGRAATAGLRAGIEHESAFAFHDALESYEQSIHILDHSTRRMPKLRSEILIRLGRIRRITAEPASRSALLDGARAAREAEARELFAVAVIELCSHGETTAAGRDDAEVVALLDEALSLDLSDDLAARLCASAATLLAFSPNAMRGSELFERSWSLARSIGDAEVEASVLMNTHLGLSRPSDFEQRITATERLGEIAGTDPLRRWEHAFLRVNHALVRADRDEADRAISEMRALTPQIRGRARDFGMAFTEASYAHATGDLDAADEHIERALAIGLKSFDASWAITIYSGIRLAILIDRNQLADLTPTIDRLIADMPTYETWHSVAAYATFCANDRERASRELHTAIRDNGRHLQRDLTWGAALMCLARAAHGLGDAIAAAWLYQELLPWVGRMSWGGSAIYGPVDLALGLAAETLGDETKAREHFAIANTLARRLGCVAYVREL